MRANCVPDHVARQLRLRSHSQPPKVELRKDHYHVRDDEKIEWQNPPFRTLNILYEFIVLRNTLSCIKIDDGAKLKKMRLRLKAFMIRDEHPNTVICPILDVPVAITTMKQAIEQVNSWISHTDRPRLVTFTNVHMLIEAHIRPGFARILGQMDMNCPDGFPVFMLARAEYGSSVEKVAGPEFMPLFCEQSASYGHRHFLYGGSPGVAEEASRSLVKRYPGIQIAGTYCPPFRDLTSDEMDEISGMINGSGADVVWVCLGCPKQEIWMAEMRDRLTVKSVLAVGQAFDIVAGRTKRSPEFLIRIGGEWLYRLWNEPKRLWKRYFVTNVLFVLLIFRERVLRRRPAVVQPPS